jgi:hypothetical protein
MMPTEGLERMKFKLQNETRSEVVSQAQFHARALRGIGQELSRLLPESFEITVEGTAFRVIGRHPSREPAGRLQSTPHLLDKLRGKLSRDGAAIAPAESAAKLVAFSRHYTMADIDRLDETGANQRGGINKLPDIYSLGEMLRMIGRIIDAEAGRLHKLSKDMNGVAFEYEDGAGQMQKREFTKIELYKLQQQYYAERGTFVPIDNWAGSF